MSNLICAGALFFSLDTERFLFVHRTKGKRSNVWGIVGGNTEDQETPWEGLKREIQEEIGSVDILKAMPLEKFQSQDDTFTFHTYLCVIKKEFLPLLNQEHDGYAWVSYDKWPRPLHYGLKNTLAKKQNQTKIKTILNVGDLFRNES
jgi:hypothetical protein